MSDDAVCILDHTQGPDPESIVVRKRDHARRILQTGFWWFVVVLVGYTGSASRGCLVLHRDAFVDAARLIGPTGVLRGTIAVAAVSLHCLVMTEVRTGRGLLFVIGLVLSLALRNVVGTCPIDYAHVYWMPVVVVPVWLVVPICALADLYQSRARRGTTLRTAIVAYAVTSIAYAVTFGAAGVISAVCDLLSASFAVGIDGILYTRFTATSSPSRPVDLVDVDKDIDAIPGDADADTDHAPAHAADRESAELVRLRVTASKYNQRTADEENALVGDTARDELADL